MSGPHEKERKRSIIDPVCGVVYRHLDEDEVGVEAWEVVVKYEWLHLPTKTVGVRRLAVHQATEGKVGSLIKQFNRTAEWWYRLI